MSESVKSNDFIKPVWAGIFIFISLCARMIWPGDVPFINDEPYFLNFGLEFSQTFDPLILGLQGKVGVKYGPYTSWFFGLLFFISKNLITVAFLKILIVSLMTVVACLWLKQNLEFVKWHSILPIMASLFLYMDARLIWDLNIPNTILAFAGYVAFMRHERFIHLLLCVLLLIFGTLTHLMCLPLVFAIVMHFFIFKWSWIKTNIFKLTILTIVVAIVGGPYYLYVFQTPKLSHHIPFELGSVWYAFLGGRLFSTHDFSYFIGDDWQIFSALPSFINYLISGMSFATYLAYFLAWIGFVQACHVLWQSRMRFFQIDIETQTLVLAIVTILFHMLFSIATDLRDHPHYYNGVWPGILIVFWFGIDLFIRHKFFKIIFVFYCVFLQFFLWKVVLDIHMKHGTRTLHYGPTLANQMAIVKNLKKIENPHVISVEAAHPKMFPQAFMFIMKTMKDIEAGPKTRISSGRVEYVTNDPKDGSIQLSIQY